MRATASACGSARTTAATERQGRRAMSSRLVVLASVLMLWPGFALAQQATGPTEVARMPWGDPDLQGIWFYQTLTPLERAEAFEDQAALSPEAAAAYVAELRAARAPLARISGDWRGSAILANGRTSQIVDPPSGKLPARTAASKHRALTLGSPPLTHTVANGPEDRERLERCIMGRSVPFLGLPFEQRVHIVQTPDHIAMNDEFGELRLIPVTNRARLSDSIRQWGGLSRGHWDGDTLVVETTHFNGKWSLMGAGRNMRLVERFSRTATETLDYEYTVHDRMGQVYRATDTQLGRDVALKILPDAFAADPDRLARFQREAQVLASLNPPEHRADPRHRRVGVCTCCGKGVEKPPIRIPGVSPS